MDSLDDIWDLPVAPNSPRRPSEPHGPDSGDPTSTKRLLVLADSNDAASPSASARRLHEAPDEHDIDVDAIFADIADGDNDDDLYSFKPIAPSIDADALRRQAEARYRQELLPGTLHQVMPSSSPVRETGTSGGGKEMKNTNPKRKPMRLDESRLLSPFGFPALIKDTKVFKTKGKGHEAEDLTRILRVYQFWTHKLYPKTQFKDTVERVEKLCHSKRMNVALSVWGDEANGLVNGRKRAEYNDNDAISVERFDGGVNNNDTISEPQSDVGNYASSSSVPSRPPTSGSEFDLDAAIQEEELRARHLTAETKTVRSTESNSAQNVLHEVDSEMWNLFNDDPDPVSVQQVLNPNKNMDSNEGDDDDVWDIVREFENAPRPDPTSTNQAIKPPYVSEAEENIDEIYM